MVKLRDFRNDRKGLAYTWSVGVCAIIGGGLLWWVLKYAMDYMTGILFAISPFTGTTLAAYNLASAIISGLPFFIIVITIIWGYIHAKAEAYE